MQNNSDHYLIREKGGEVLRIADDTKGKIILFVTRTKKTSGDIFSVGVSWKSIDSLREMMKQKTFSWEIKDRSLAVTGQDGQITLRFVTVTGPTVTAEAVLSEEEASLFRSALSEGTSAE